MNLETNRAGATPAAVPVVAKIKKNVLAVQVEANVEYVLEATGRWYDKSIGSGAEGYDFADLPPLPRFLLRLGRPFLRVPDVRYFALIVMVEGSPLSDALIFRGERARWTPRRSGRLVAFANDVPWFYGNNCGCLMLTVTPAPSTAAGGN